MTCPQQMPAARLRNGQHKGPNPPPIHPRIAATPAADGTTGCRYGTRHTCANRQFSLHLRENGPETMSMCGTRNLGNNTGAGKVPETAWQILPALLLAASVLSAQAQNVETPVFKLPEQIEFKGTPGTLQTATLFGDPAKPEIFVQRMKLPAGLKIKPHSHPDSPRTVAVLSGTLYYAVGKVWDESKLKALPAGTFFTEAPEMAHFAWAKDGEVVLQLTSIGPTGTILLKAPQ
jgi:quercetin dioxygenase-like cupin family protein